MPSPSSSSYFAFVRLGARSCLEERSYLDRAARREALRREVLARPTTRLDPAGCPRRSISRACPSSACTLVEDGVARGVVWDRRTAKRAGDGHESTGHAPPPRCAGIRPAAVRLSVAAGDVGSIDELAELVGDGIYVTRLHYLGIVDPREGIITGMTRDGTFRIEDGKVPSRSSTSASPSSFPSSSRASSVFRRGRAREPQRLLRRALPLRDAGARDRHGAFTIVGTGSGPGL